MGSQKEQVPFILFIDITLVMITTMIAEKCPDFIKKGNKNVYKMAE